ncbi:hypothetical protein HYDPIDRAFT_120383 [Hydnomerulius pinastri MD-312]|uniref:Uncharacterized protein n=1 Tax=Hydnomerulius pinastri MD-312 TaxID=994086 RepID=A0A0C9VJW2_9AGAM|nr:hypothetical protein HYDPIDRAFT_120383 [Hydnomerulius pinastri MD-312]
MLVRFEDLSHMCAVFPYLSNRMLLSIGKTHSIKLLTRWSKERLLSLVRSHNCQSSCSSALVIEFRVRLSSRCSSREVSDANPTYTLVMSDGNGPWQREGIWYMPGSLLDSQYRFGGAVDRARREGGGVFGCANWKTGLRVTRIKFPVKIKKLPVLNL